MMVLLLFIYQLPSQPFFSSPQMTVHGVVMTDNRCSALYEIQNGTVTELVSAPGCGRYFAVSADKKFIGFKLIGKDGYQAPAVLDVDSRSVLLLHDPVQFSGQVSFSGTGATCFTIGRQLIVLTDTCSKTFTLDACANVTPISPDAQQVVYNDNKDQLWLLDVSTGMRKCFTDEKLGYCCPQWSPDGRHIMYTSLTGYIFVYKKDKGKTYSLGRGNSPSWSPDSRSIVFYRVETDGHELTGSDLYMTAVDGAAVSRLTTTPRVHEMDPVFIDDRTILYHTYEQREICVAELDGTTLRGASVLYEHQDSVSVRHAGFSVLFGTRDSIDVPYLHQVYDTPDWFDGHWACAPTTAMMAIAYYRKLPRWNCWCSSPYGHTCSYGRYICERYHYREVDYYWEAQDPSGTWAQGGYGYMWYNGYSPHSRMADYIGYHGLSSWTDDSPTWSETVTEVTAGYPYCMCVGLTTSGHLVLAVGQVLNWHTLICNDPYGNKNTAGYPSYDGKYSRYDWPGYNNGYENLNNVYWCTGARGDWEPPTDTLVDDLQFDDGFYLHTDEPSTMRFWWDALTGYSGHMWWTYTTSANEDTCHATWTPVLNQAGSYSVYAYVPAVHSDATQAQYRVFFSTGSTSVAIDQSGFTDEWVYLGTYTFPVNGGYVYLGDATGTQGQQIGFDAMVWRYEGPGIEEKTSVDGPHRVSVHTNPVGNILSLSIGCSTETTVGFVLYDITGQCVFSEEKNIAHSVEHRICVADLPAGVYFLKVSLDKEEIVKKCVIVH